MTKLIELGFCRKPHGVKGAFSFHLHNSESSVLKKGFKIQLFPLSSDSTLSKEGEEFEISSISFGNKVIATLKGVDNRNRVEEMLPFSILADRSSFPETDEGEVYLSDLVGCQAIDEDGQVVGEVVDLGFNGVQDILVIQGKEEKIEVLFIDSFVLGIDVEKREIIIKVPEYF